MNSQIGVKMFYWKNIFTLNKYNCNSHNLYSILILCNLFNFPALKKNWSHHLQTLQRTHSTHILLSCDRIRCDTCGVQIVIQNIFNECRMYHNIRESTDFLHHFSKFSIITIIIFILRKTLEFDSNNFCFLCVTKD